ncbi:MAG: hypothetical protein ABW168_12565 [Sedimenticola sp.]
MTSRESQNSRVTTNHMDPIHPTPLSTANPADHNIQTRKLDASNYMDPIHPTPLSTADQISQIRQLDTPLNIPMSNITNTQKTSDHHTSVSDINVILIEDETPAISSTTESQRCSDPDPESNTRTVPTKSDQNESEKTSFLCVPGLKHIPPESDKIMVDLKRKN